MRMGIVVAAAALLAGCKGTTSGPDLKNVPFPVLVGPVHRIGGGKADLAGTPRTLETMDQWFSKNPTNAPSLEGTPSASTAFDKAGRGLPAGCIATVKDLKGVAIYYSFFVPYTNGTGDFGYGTYVWGEFELWSREPWPLEIP